MITGLKPEPCELRLLCCRRVPDQLGSEAPLSNQILEIGGACRSMLYARFEAAARHANFAKAAAEIGVTPSAMSHQVRRLEQQIGVPLFERQRLRIRLSPEGTILSQCLTKSFDDIEETIRNLSPADDHSLVISVMAAFVAKWLAPRLAEFASLRPELRIKLLADDDLTDFSVEKVDVGIRCSWRPHRKSA